MYDDVTSVSAFTRIPSSPFLSRAPLRVRISRLGGQPVCLLFDHNLKNLDFNAGRISQTCPLLYPATCERTSNSRPGSLYTSTSSAFFRVNHWLILVCAQLYPQTWPTSSRRASCPSHSDIVNDVFVVEIKNQWFVSFLSVGQTSHVYVNFFPIVSRC